MRKTTTKRENNKPNPRKTSDATQPNNWPINWCLARPWAMAALANFHSGFTADHHVVSYGISLRSFAVSCPFCVLSQLLVHPRPTHWWVEWEAEKAMTLYKDCWATTKPSLCSSYAVFFMKPKHISILATMKKLPAKTSTEVCNILFIFN